MLWRGGGVTGSVEVAVAPSIVVIAAQLSGSLAWVTISAEDAPESLTSAPATRQSRGVSRYARGDCSPNRAVSRSAHAGPSILFAEKRNRRRGLRDRGGRVNCNVELLAASACKARHGPAPALSVSARCSAGTRSHPHLGGRMRGLGHDGRGGPRRAHAGHPSTVVNSTSRSGCEMER